MRSELRREILNKVKNNVIKDVINDLDVFGCVHELNNEQNKDIDIITQKLCFVVEELESIVTNAVNESVNIAQQEMYVDDTDENIYQALIKGIKGQGNVLYKPNKMPYGYFVRIDNEFSIIYDLDHKIIDLFNGDKSILRFNKNNKLLSGLMELVDEGMRGE